MNRFVVAVVAAGFVVAGCTASPGAPAPASPTVTPVAASPATPSTAPAVATPSVARTVEGEYGARLRVIPSDGSAHTCRPLSAHEKGMTARHYRVSDPKPAAAVDLAEGWSVVAWVYKGETLAFVTKPGEFQRGITYQLVPTNGLWRGTHTNAGIAWEDGPEALRAALRCVTDQA